LEPDLAHTCVSSLGGCLHTYAAGLFLRSSAFLIGARNGSAIPPLGLLYCLEQTGTYFLTTPKGHFSLHIHLLSSYACLSRRNDTQWVTMHVLVSLLG